MMSTNNAFYGIIERQRLNSIRKELFRKSIHICSSVTPLLLKYYRIPTLILLVAGVLLYSLSELLRLKGIQVPLISKVTETAARKRDENRFVLGPVTLVFGIFCAALFFPLEHAALGIFALAFGDGFASLIGKLIGKVPVPGTRGKTVAGSLACFFAVFCSSFFICKSASISFTIAFCTMLIEVLPLADFDNILIPVIISGISCFVF